MYAPRRADQRTVGQHARQAVGQQVGGGGGNDEEGDDQDRADGIEGADRYETDHDHQPIVQQSGAEAERGGQRRVEGGEFQLLVEQNDNDEGEQCHHRHDRDRFGPEDQDRLLLGEAGLPGLRGAVFAAVDADLGELGFIVAGADAEIAAVDTLAGQFGARVVGVTVTDSQALRQWLLVLAQATPISRPSRHLRRYERLRQSAKP